MTTDAILSRALSLTIRSLEQHRTDAERAELAVEAWRLISHLIKE